MRDEIMEQTGRGAAASEAVDAAEDRTERDLAPAARRALAEAKARRRAAEAEEARHPQPKEIGGRGGKDPARYGDWEIKGRAIDF